MSKKKSKLHVNHPTPTGTTRLPTIIPAKLCSNINKLIPNNIIVTLKIVLNIKKEAQLIMFIIFLTFISFSLTLFFCHNMDNSLFLS